MPESLGCFTALSKMPQRPRQYRPLLTFLMYQQRRNYLSYKTSNFIPKFVCDACHNVEWVLSLVLALWTGANPHLPWVCMCVLGEEGVEVTGSSLLCTSIWDAESIFLAAPDFLLAGIWCWGVYCCKDVPRIPGSLRNLLCRRALTQCCSVTFLCCFCAGKRRNGSCVAGCCWHCRDSCCDLLRSPVVGNDSSSGSG